jgi:excisionase family DNA binding protein
MFSSLAFLPNLECMKTIEKNFSCKLTQGSLFNRREIADYIGVCERTVSNMMTKRVIPVIKIGKSVRFDPIKVRKALEKYEIESL